MIVREELDKSGQDFWKIEDQGKILKEFFEGKDNWSSYNLRSGQKNVLVTTAIGKTYFEDWEKYSLPSWLEYCEKYDLGIICISKDLISSEDPSYKNGSWQKFLAPKAVTDFYTEIERICLLDTDIQISPFAPNIFNDAPTGKYSIVSQLSGLPFPLPEVLRRMAYFRHNFYSSEYPLDSFLLGDVFDEFRDLQIEPPADYFCAGLIVLDKKHVTQMFDWFFEVQQSQNFHGWEQTHMNSWVQNEPHHWLPYEYQALWNYEMSWKYPFLYSLEKNIDRAAETRAAVEASLWNNHFLHFAGSWYESRAWKIEPSLPSSEFFLHAKVFDSFRVQKFTGKKFGQVFPKG